MKRILTAAVLLTVSLIAGAQGHTSVNDPLSAGVHEQTPTYDSVLARKLGADDLGMKTYVLVILKSGPAKIEEKELRDSLFRGHFSNMDKLAAEGILVAAGPFSANDNQYRGLFLLDVKSFGEAEELVKGDPTVTSGIFITEMYQWYGSAAITLLNDIHKRIQKQKP